MALTCLLFQFFKAFKSTSYFVEEPYTVIYYNTQLRLINLQKSVFLIWSLCDLLKTLCMYISPLQAIFT